MERMHLMLSSLNKCNKTTKIYKKSEYKMKSLRKTKIQIFSLSRVEDHSKILLTLTSLSIA
jgi:hypothetical protein